MKNIMQKKQSGAGIILSLFFLPALLFAGNGTVFQYAFIVKTGNGTVDLLDTSGTHTPIDTTARVRILLKPLNNVFCYLFLHDAEGDLTVLFPEQTGGQMHADTLYRIPGPASWLVPTGNNGTESFYLLVSETRLHRLEKLVEKYLDLPATATGKKKKAIDRIVNEITLLRRTHSSFSEKALSPVVIAGDYRGFESTENPPARMVKVRFSDFYAKTIRLVH